MGCSDAPFTEQRSPAGDDLHQKLEVVTAELISVDINEQAIRFIAIHCKNSECRIWDVASPNLPAMLQDTEFDLNICANLIEHVSSPGLMMENLRRPLAKDGALIITTINAYAAKALGRAMLKKAVHDDHVSYYSILSPH